MISDIGILNKCTFIERSLRRINEEYRNVNDLFGIDYRGQDSIILNLQRACEAAIDFANYLVKKKKLGVPRDSRAVFEILGESSIISHEIAEKMKRMVGFRSLSVHAYQNIDMQIVQQIIENNLSDFTSFTSTIQKNQI